MYVFQSDKKDHSYLSEDTVTTPSNEQTAGSTKTELTMQYSELIARMAKHLTPKYGENSQRFRNLTSALNAYLQYFNVAHSAQVGGELIKDFNKNVSIFLNDFSKQGRSTQTIRDRKSQLRQWHQLFAEAEHKQKHPQCRTHLQAALHQNLSTSGYSVKGLARDATISLSTLKGWLSGSHPNQRARPSLERVERQLKVEPGSLVKLVIWGSRSSHPRHQEEMIVIPYRQRLAKLNCESYALKDVPADLKKEWMEYFKYKTSLFPTLKRSKRGMWRIRPIANTSPLYDSEFSRTDTGICPTANITWGKVSYFLGFLMLPVEKGGFGLTQGENLAISGSVEQALLVRNLLLIQLLIANPLPARWH